MEDSSDDYDSSISSIGLRLEVVLLNCAENYLLDSKVIFNHQNAYLCHLYQVCINAITLPEAVRTSCKHHHFC